jgi:hypothetical protein
VYGLGTLLAVSALEGGCEAKFVGPYPCRTGYASCVDPAQDRCETRTFDDALNCGGCGDTCNVGAACIDGRCGSAAPQIASLSGIANGSLAIGLNSTAIFWEASNTVWTVPIAGGTPTMVTTNAFTCGSTSSFAVDDQYLYVLSTGGLGLASGGLARISLASGASTLLVPTSNQSGCASLAVDATSVYLQSFAQNGGGVGEATVSRVPIDGGTPTVLATLQSINSSAMAVTQTDVIAATAQGNGATSFAVIPLAGGPPRTITVDPSLGGGGSAFAVDASNIYLLSGGCPCNGSPSDAIQSTGLVAKVPLDGSPGTILARFVGLPGTIGVDASHVYWSTDVAIWRVPTAGGPEVAMAGNLGAGSASYLCTSGCSIPGSEVALALGPGSIFVEDGNASVNAILEVSK